MNYNEIFCESMEIIAKNVLDGISYDKTIACKIVKDDKKKQGEYTVSNGSMEFVAYSQDQSYYKGAMVYVTIPEGDYNNTKIIVGKKANTDLEPYTYKTPFSDFLDVSENLYLGDFSNGLTANDPTEGQNAILLYEETYKTGFSDFTRFGIRADFKSWLKEMDCVTGEYGLKIILEFQASSTTSDEEKKTYTKSLYLNTNDMIGNPYAFESFFSQEQVYDISTFGAIIGIKVYFYQVPGSFKDIEGKEIPYYNEDFREDILLSNLFVQNIQLYVGYDLNNYSSDLVQLYTFNSTTFVNTKPKDEKKVYLKWVHILEDGTRLKMEEYQENNFEIRWYQYKLGEPSADEYSGPYWKRVNYSESDSEFKKFNYTFTPDVSKKEVEQIKVIILYNDMIYRSNIITFSNDKPVVNDATIDAIKALSLICKDIKDGLKYDSYGNYFIYDLGNRLINSSQASTKRILECHLKLEGQEESFINLIDTDTITWQIPIKNTMISYSGEIPENQKNNNYIEIVWDQKKIKEIVSEGVKYPFISYTIKNYYSHAYSNNTINCIVNKNGIQYNASKTLQFGQAGTTGTDYTLVLNIDDNKQVITYGKDTSIGVTARLYDIENKELDLTGKSVSWSWFKKSVEDNNLGIEIGNSTTSKNTLIINNKLTVESLYILSATLTGWGDYPLTAYLPIPIRSSENYGYIDGTTQLIYLTDGTIDYYRGPYVLYDKNGQELKNLTWRSYPILASNNEMNRYLPGLRKDNLENKYYLNPINLYVEDLPIFGIQAMYNNSVVWSQPILIIQNKYPNASVNAWDGKSLQIGDNYVIGKMLGAGRKNNDNTFNGVLLGDVRESAIGKNQRTGVYGFDKGVLAYSFTDDGKATIGKATGSQLIFDGTKSTITSGSYSKTSSAYGLMLDFDKGIISAKRTDKEIFKIQNENPYLKIQNLSDKILMYVGDSSYYLKSANYKYTASPPKNDSSPAGMFINLSDGNIYAKQGSFYGDIKINPSTGGTYTSYSYSNGTIIPNPNASLGTTQTSLTNLLANIKSTASYASALASKANDNATVAQKAAKQAKDAAEKAQDALDELAWVEIYGGINGNDIWFQSKAKGSTERITYSKIFASKSGAGFEYYNKWGEMTSQVILGSKGINLNSGNLVVDTGGKTQFTVMDESLNEEDGNTGIFLVSGNIHIEGTINGSSSGSSDIRVKTNIKNNLFEYKKFFFDLNPVSYSYKNNLNKIHIGYIAQEIKNLITKYELDKESLPIISIQKTKEYNDQMYIDYASFTGLNTFMIQEAYKEIDFLRKEIQELKERINDE